MRLKNLLLGAAFIVYVLGTAGAQQPQSEPTPTGLALEVTYLQGNPPAYSTVQSLYTPNGAGWFARFGRVPQWQLPAGALPIQSVRIVSYLRRDQVRVRVSVLRGVKFHDVEEWVTTLVARENEKLTIGELANFGVEPFQVKLLKVGAQSSELPSIVNNTNSLEVVGIEPMVSTFARYKLNLHNRSDKNISALEINVTSGGRLLLSGMPQGRDGEPLIKARSSSELKQPMSTRAQATPAGFIPTSSLNQQIVITTLMYEDGTYEGDVKPAATFRGFTFGRRTELKRIVPVLESALVTYASSEDLRRQLSELSYDADEADVETLAAAFPNITRLRLRSPIETAIHGVRKDLLEELKRFDRSEPSAESYRIWLTGLRDRYSNWIARLSK